MKIKKQNAAPTLPKFQTLAKLRLSVLLLTFLLISNITTAQNNYYASFVGDTIDLAITAPNGTVQWQQTDDTLTAWSNITGATSNPYMHIIGNSGTGYKYYRVAITNSAVCNAGPFFSDVIKHKIITHSSEVSVGNYYVGGIVFYTDGIGHGLVTAAHDQSTNSWGCEGNEISGADGSIIGTGQQNTTDILAGCTTQGIAAYICDTLTLNQYTDWYLPSKEELEAMYLHKDTIGNFTDAYWSSTEYNLDAQYKAWKLNFTTYNLAADLKSSPFSIRAIRSYPRPAPPRLTLDSIRDINPVSSNIYVNVTDSGTAPVTERGICWSMTIDPTTDDNKRLVGAGKGEFNSAINLLTANTTYHVRAYAINSIDTAYSSDSFFTTTVDFSNSGTVDDYDGNTYQTVNIGTQVWMQENLKTTHYADGTIIPLVTDNTAWGDLGDNEVDKAYCYYNNNASSEVETYGALYTYAAATNGENSGGNVQGACPEGWHLPSDIEWNTLTNFLGGEVLAGSKLADNTVLWTDGSLEQDVNFGISGFFALPAGYRNSVDGTFYELGSNNTWWSATQSSVSLSYYRRIINSNSSVYIGNTSKSFGASVRCIRNTVQQRLDNGETPLEIYNSNVPLDSLYGKTYQGGLIFYLNTISGLGYVSASTDQSSGTVWGCHPDALSGADGTAIGTGKQNTIDIITNCTTSGIAAKICADLDLNGYDDWFLPSRYELNEMYVKLHTRGYGGFNSAAGLYPSYYWSSSEQSPTHAWYSIFNHSGSWALTKTYSFRVRAIREF